MRNNWMRRKRKDCEEVQVLKIKKIITKRTEKRIYIRNNMKFCKKRLK